MRQRANSQAVFESSCRVIPGGVNSPVRAFRSLHMTPLIVKRGAGDTIWDIDGHSYIDYCCSWGSLILGHAYPSVTQKAVEQVLQGSSFGIATQLEAEIAALVQKHVPAMEKIRFVSSGTEATMTALRLARGFTGRSTILKFNGNYHGHVDALLIRAGSGVAQINTEASSKGIPADVVRHTVSLPFNAIEQTQEFIRSCPDLAAVILEPISGNMGVIPAKQEFVNMLREETRKNGALLIFDEVITGFRVGLQSAQGMYGIVPDLSCFGKIIGGGYPAAAFGGRAEIMDHLAPLGEVYQAGTLSGNPVAMAAGLQTLKELEVPDFYNKLKQKTDLLIQPIQEWINQKQFPASINQVGSMFTLFFGIGKPENYADLAQLDHDLFRKFYTYLFERGIYLSPSPYEAHFISSVHTEEHLIETRNLILQFLYRT